MVTVSDVESWVVELVMRILECPRPYLLNVRRHGIFRVTTRMITHPRYLREHGTVPPYVLHTLRKYFQVREVRNASWKHGRKVSYVIQFYQGR